MTIQKLNNGLKLKGHVSLRVFDADGNPLPELNQETDNIITTNGWYELADVLIGEKTISHIGVGQGTTGPTESDTDLETPIQSRIPITESTRAGAICLFSTFFGTTDCNPDSGDWTEAVLATAESGENIISRALFSNPFHKSSANRCYVDWTITISAGDL